MQIAFDVEINTMFGGKEKVNSRYKFHFIKLFFDLKSFIYLDWAVAEDPVAVMTAQGPSEVSDPTICTPTTVYSTRAFKY